MDPIIAQGLYISGTDLTAWLFSFSFWMNWQSFSSVCVFVDAPQSVLQQWAQHHVTTYCDLSLTIN